MIRNRILGALAALLFASPAFALPATAPLVYDAMGRPLQAQAHICIDLTGAFVSCGGGSAAAAANLATLQVSVGTSATLVAASRSGRQFVSIENTGTTAAYCGQTSGVTTSTGHLLPGQIGASINLAYSGDVYCIVASGTATVSKAEAY